MATTPTQIPSAEIKIRVPRLLLASLNEMCRLATMPLESLIAQLIEVQIAEFRRRKIPADFLTPKAGDPRAVAAEGGNEIHREKLDADDKGEIRELRDAGESVDGIAKRKGVSKSTIRRALKKREQRDCERLSAK